ncbi:MAG TPA: SAM-dependent methyltransferase [Nocardioidaceae bacterium]|nr:SAM-dependent methyltransferase [Nocardioidaceae bacterium]
MSQTSLGMPAMPPPTTAPTWKQAWDQALYGEQGFFRRESPADHFRTSVHASPLVAQALLRLCREVGLDTVVDVGSGRGELLRQLHDLDPTLTLLGVEVAPRPEDLPEAIAWSPVLPTEVDGLVFANEWLDNVPCHVVEAGEDGVVRVVHVTPDGTESLGARVDDRSVPPSLSAWCAQWWPAAPGERAEVGTTRDSAWADVVSRVTRGLAIAVDYGHLRGDRPPYGSLRSYAGGREVEVLPDGSRDVTAHVAVDAVAAACGGHVTTQREALSALGVTAQRPDINQASSDPAAYLQALATAGEAAELTGPGLGDFYWVVSAVGIADPFLA